MRKSRLLIVLLVTIVLALFVSNVFAAENYTVQPGDSLTKIARLFGTNYLVLAEANDLEPPFIINVGQVLIIPDVGEGANAVDIAVQHRL